MGTYEERALIEASGQVLIEHLPSDFNNMKDGELMVWLESVAWEPYECWDGMQLWEQIENVACTLRRFHESEQKRGRDNGIES